MRMFSGGSIVLMLTMAVAAQTPSPAAKRMPKAHAVDKPAGDLVQVMRGVLFNNANLIFDVQQVDPAKAARAGKTEAGETATASFAGVYSGGRPSRTPQWRWTSRSIRS